MLEKLLPFANNTFSLDSNMLFVGNYYNDRLLTHHDSPVFECLTTSSSPSNTACFCPCVRVMGPADIYGREVVDAFAIGTGFGGM